MIRGNRQRQSLQRILSEKNYYLIVIRDYSASEHLLSRTDLNQRLQFSECLPARGLRDHHGHLDSFLLHHCEEGECNRDDRVRSDRHRHKQLLLRPNKGLLYLVENVVLTSHDPDVRLLLDAFPLVKGLKLAHRVRLTRFQRSLEPDP